MYIDVLCAPCPFSRRRRRLLTFSLLRACASIFLCSRLIFAPPHSLRLSYSNTLANDQLNRKQSEVRYRRGKYSEWCIDMYTTWTAAIRSAPPAGQINEWRCDGGKLQVPLSIDRCLLAPGHSAGYSRGAS